MKEPKKKWYIVKCIVNMDAGSVRDVWVKTTKPELAARSAEKLLMENGYRTARAFSCEVRHD